MTAAFFAALWLFTAGLFVIVWTGYHEERDANRRLVAERRRLLEELGNAPAPVALTASGSETPLHDEIALRRFRKQLDSGRQA